MLAHSACTVFCGSGVMSRPQSLHLPGLFFSHLFPGTIGMNNRGAMGGTNVPAAAPPATGPGAMIPDGAMGMVMYLHLLLCTPFKCRLFSLLSNENNYAAEVELVCLTRPVA